MDGRRVAYLGRRGCTTVDFERFLANPPAFVAVDIETVSLKDKRVVGIGMSGDGQDAWYVPFLPEISPYATDALIRVVDNPNITKIYHNCLFDLPALLPFGADTSRINDTLILCYLTGMLPGLKEAAKVCLGMEIAEISDVLPKGKSMLDLPYEVVADKCCRDVQATWRLHMYLVEHVDAKYAEREMKLVPMLIRMSQRGIRLDQERRGELEIKYAREARYYKDIAEAQGFNPGSPQQVGYILAQNGNFLPFKRHKSGRTNWQALDTSESVLRTVDDPMAAIVLNYRSVSKLLSTYLVPWRGVERAHTRFHLGTATGRLASTDRNLQNIPPGEIRSIFLPDGKVFTDFDYSQQELRTLAYVSQDREMLDIYEQGKDIHQETADFLGIARKVAKNTNFAMVYGATPETIMETAGIQSRAMAMRLMNTWANKFPQAFNWIKDTQEFGVRHRKVQTLGGRWLYLPMPYEEDEKEVVRKAVNYPIQGSAAELTKEAMLRLDGLDPVLQVHDEMLMEGQVEKSELLARGLEWVGPFHTPIELKYLERWQ